MLTEYLNHVNHAHLAQRELPKSHAHMRFYEKLVGKGNRPLHVNLAVMRRLLYPTHGVRPAHQDVHGERLLTVAT